VDPAMGPAVVQQPKHGKARCTAELIGVDMQSDGSPHFLKSARGKTDVSFNI
jgi:hypothetical protein